MDIKTPLKRQTIGTRETRVITLLPNREKLKTQGFFFDKKKPIVPLPKLSIELHVRFVFKYREKQLLIQLGMRLLNSNYVR